MTETATETLAGRFEIERKIGEGGQGVTWLARDRQTERRVAVKELAVGDVADWKAIELFEREADALESLDHPAIPAYIHSFHVEGDDGERLFLAQEFVDGKDLKRLVEEGLRLDEERARTWIEELLEILAYIHGLQPPVIHRDVKPSNIIEQPDGCLALVDFGAAQLINPSDTGGSTVVGTTGYMPIEQMMGRAVPATDLYALGATAVHLLSHKHPGELDVVEMELQFRDHINVSDAFADWLEDMLAPHVEDRFASAEEALAALRDLGTDEAGPEPVGEPKPLQRNPMATTQAELDLTRSEQLDEHSLFIAPLYDGEVIPKPDATDITCEEDEHEVRLEIPATGLQGDALSWALMAFVGGVVPIFFLVASLTGAFQPDNESSAVCCLAFWAVPGTWLIYKALQGIFEYVTVSLDANGVRISRRLLGWSRTQFISHDEFRGVDVVPDVYQGEREHKRPISWTVQVASRNGEFTFADTREPDELVWIAGKIRDAMRRDR